MTLFQFLDAYAPVKYAHAVIGKWHLSSVENGGADHPELAGVGSYSGLIEGTLDDYYHWPRTVGGETEMVDGYITSVLTDEAIDWIDAQGARPWFLWLAHVAPHLPLHAPPDDLTMSVSLDGSRQDMQSQLIAYYFAALEALDTEIGRLLDSIPPSVRDNTVVIFIGDNGTPIEPFNLRFKDDAPRPASTKAAFMCDDRGRQGCNAPRSERRGAGQFDRYFCDDCQPRRDQGR